MVTVPALAPQRGRKMEWLASPDNGTWLYDYDKQGRLGGATAPDEAEYDYAYDGAGNRMLVEETRRDNDVERVTSTVTDYVGAQPDKATTTVTVAGVDSPSVVTDYSHDGAGNLIRIDGPGGWRTFSYDHWGRLQTTSNAPSPDAEVTRHVYTYDGLDRTLAKATSTVTAGIETAVARELYWHAGLSHELVQTSLRGPEGSVEDDMVVTSYGYREGTPHSVQRLAGAAAPGGELLEDVPLDSSDPDASTTLLGTNPHGDVVYSMNKEDELQSITSYDPWGDVRTQVGDDGMLGFQSDPTDPDTGLVDMESRNYLPELGRFITRDSYVGETTDPPSLNRYAYGGGDPVSTFDPTGHMAAKGPGGGGFHIVEPGSSAHFAMLQQVEQRAPVDEPGDYGSASPEVLAVTIPRWGMGTIRGAGFISATAACGVNYPLVIKWYCGSGDGRGFSPYAHASRSKIAWTFDTDAGVGEVVVNPSCNPAHAECVSALPLNAWLVRGNQVMALNQAEVESTAAAVTLRFRVLNSRYPLGYAAIQGDLTFTRTSDAVNVAGATTSYPSFEIYRIDESMVCTLVQMTEQHISGLSTGPTTAVSGTC